MEFAAFALFCAGVVASVLAKLPVLAALGFGFLIFTVYGMLKGNSLGSLMWAAWQGAKLSGTVVIMLLVLGVMTAAWRTCGTVPYILAVSCQYVSAQSFLLVAFLLNCLMSFLLGSSFGTAATMGVACMLLGSTAGMDPMGLGGACLAGAYFGDRFSPVSSCAALVREITGTTLRENMESMARTTLLPVVLTCCFYALVGYSSIPSSVDANFAEVFSQEFLLHPVLLLPAAFVVILPLCHVDVFKTLVASTAAALALAFIVQGTSPLVVLNECLLGYSSQTPDIAVLIDGGGIASMVEAVLTVGLSSSYAGIFNLTGMLKHVQKPFQNLARKTTAYTGALTISVLMAMVSCNQTLALLLTNQLGKSLEPNPGKLALDLEDTVVVISGLVPWSIACSIPLAVLGVEAGALLFAPMLWLLPLQGLVLSALRKRGKIEGQPMTTLTERRAFAGAGRRGSADGDTGEDSPAS